jgi:hypothetical protein
MPAGSGAAAPWRPGRWLAALLLLALAGCSGRTYRIGLEMEADQRAMLQVTGRQLVLTVSNAGPGMVEVGFDSVAPVAERRRRIGRGAASVEMPGPVWIVLDSGQERVDLTVEARHATAVTIEQAPQPRRP